MNYSGSKTLACDRVILRAPQVSDAPQIYKNYASRPEVTMYLSWSPHQSVEETEKYLGLVEQLLAHGKEYAWAIVDKKSREVIGNISVVDRKENISCVHLGYVISPEFQNQGLMTEVLKRIIQFFFEEENALRIEAAHDVRNPGSGRVMEKAGMTYEGTSRQRVFTQSGIGDAANYGIIKSEYEKTPG